MTDGEERPLGRSAWRGVCGRCPRCGQDRLFQHYLKQVDRCAVCGHPWSEISADDAPPWLTILIVGHLMAPLILLMARHDDLPLWLTTVTLLGLGLALCLLVLPRAKGLFIAVIWALRAGSS